MKLSTTLPILGAIALAATGYGGDLALKVETQQAAYGIGEPVVLHCVFTNETDRAATVDLGYNQQAIFFVLNPGSPTEMKLPIAVRHGGMFVPDQQTLQPNQSLSRFVVFDQWFRPGVPGDYQFEFHLPMEQQEVRAPFTLRVGETNAAHVKTGARLLIDRYDQLKAAPRSEPAWREQFNCRCAIELYCTYLPGSFQGVLDELKREYASDHVLGPLIQGAEAAGPGLCRILD